MTVWFFILAAAVLAPRQLEVKVYPPQPVQGQLMVVELEGTESGDQVEGFFDQRPLRFYTDAEGRLRALTAVPLRRKAGDVSMVIQVTPPDQDVIIHGLSVSVQEGQFDTEELIVDPKYVKTPKKYKARVRRERRKFKKLWKNAATPRKWQGSFEWPRQDEIVSTFGLRREFNNQLKSRHWGVDIYGKNGDPILAIGAGKVVLILDAYYAGRTIVIDHGLKLFSLYFHLSKYDVELGQFVERGQLIGRVGTTGRVTGPHLHLSTKIENISFDPMSLFDFNFEVIRD
jgi:hypothetical protein